MALCHIWPGITLAALILLFGAYVLVDGICTIILAIGGWKERDDRWLLLITAAGLGRPTLAASLAHLVYGQLGRVSPQQSSVMTAQLRGAGFDVQIINGHSSTKIQQALTEHTAHSQHSAARRPARPVPTFIAALKQFGREKALETGALATCKAYGMALQALGHANPRILAVDGDVRNSTHAEHFYMFMADAPEDIPILGQTYGFATLQRAQALGDLLALGHQQRLVIHIHLGSEMKEGSNGLLRAC